MATRIPITKDTSFGFEDRQDDIWKRMEEDMERRRRDWETEIEKMSTDFFSLRPNERGSPQGRRFEPMQDRVGIAESYDDGKSVIEKNDQGQPVFRARFNVKDYKPEEVNVKMDSNKIIVQGKHEENSGGASVSREYSREVNIPKEIDPMALQCTISPEGVLTVEAPVPAPGYLKEPPVPAPDYNIGKEGPGTPTKTGMTQPPLSMNAFPSAQQQQQQHVQQHQQQRVSTPPQKTQPSQYTTVFHSGPLSGNYQSQPSQPPSFDQFQPSMGHSTTPPPSYQSQAPSKPPPQQQQQQYTMRSSSNSMGSPRTASPVMVTEKKFKIETDIEDFNPEDLTVKTLDKKIMITARKQEKSGNRTSTREMNREFHIPENVDPYTVKAFFTEGGRLILEAPYKQTTSGGYTNGGLQYSASPMTGR